MQTEHLKIFRSLSPGGSSTFPERVRIFYLILSVPDSKGWPLCWVIDKAESWLLLAIVQRTLCTANSTESKFMPLRITSAPVAGVQKRKSKQPRQPRSSLFASHARSKPNTRKANNDKSKSNDGPVIDEPDQYYDDSDVEPLPDLGSAARYIADARPDNVRGVVDAIQHIKTTMFEELPTERAGMNSTRIAQVLNLRRALPPIVSVAHVHTVLQSPTEVEREIVALAQSGRVRRLIVPGRGRDTAALGDCLVLSEDFAELVRGSDLDSALKGG